jgi:thiamine biosynthesis lipoprotein
MSVDLGGIAKGFALDEIASDLRAVGIARGLVVFGRSSVWALGAPADASHWRLEVRGDPRAPKAVVALRDQAVSVSSSWGRTHRIEGRAYSHVIDPRTGTPLSSGRQAVVVAGDATQAEVISTALLILSEEEGRALVSQKNAEAWVVDEDGDSWETDGWAALLVPGDGRTRHRLSSSPVTALETKPTRSATVPGGTSSKSYPACSYHDVTLSDTRIASAKV